MSASRIALPAMFALILPLLTAAPAAAYRYLFVSRGPVDEEMQVLLVLGVFCAPLVLLGLIHYYGCVHAVGRSDRGQPLPEVVAQGSVVWALVFSVVLLSAGMTVMLVRAYKAFPFPEPPEQEQIRQLILGQEEEAEDAGRYDFTRRWLTSREREQPRERRPARSGGGGGGFPGGPDELALRTVSEGVQLRSSHFGMPPTAAWERLMQPPLKGSFREYEEQRYISQMLLEKFILQQENPEVLAAWKEAATKTAQYDHANFEDHFYAGISQLLSGDKDVARKHLEQSFQASPRTGSFFGNLYLYMMLLYAVHDKHYRVLAMVQQFKRVHPDWLYTETYLPDLEDMREVYPDAPLLDVIEGRLRYYVMDYRGAEQAYVRALDAELPAAARGKVLVWLRELRAELGKGDS